MSKKVLKGGESLPLARTSLLATPSSGGHPRNTPVDTSIVAPYELPEGWKWERASNFADIFTGNSINENVKKEKYTGITEGLNFIGTKDVDFDGTINYENGVKISDYENFKTVPSNTPLLCIEGGSAGKKLGITSEQVCFGNKLCAFVCKNVEPKLVYYYLQTNAFFYSFMKERHGLIGGVSVGTLKNIPFPLPPTLAEQQRIVNRIETMFAKLDQAQEKAQSVLDIFETRKAAILHKAFTGELTANWRKENGVSDDSWEEKLFDSCIAKMQNGISKRSGSEGEETVVLRLANIGENDFDVSDLRTIKLTSKEQDNYSLTRDDVVMIRVNGSKTNVGRQILVNNNNGWSFCDHIIRIKYETFCMPSYMVYFSHTKEYKDYVQDNMVSSAGQNTISRKGLSNLRLKIPSLPEQQEIVRILDTVLEKENRAKEAAQTVLDQIALLKKSILARAFRGEL